MKRPSSGSGVKGGFSNTMIKLGRPGEGREGHLRKRDQNVQRPRSWRVAPSLELCVLFFFFTSEAEHGCEYKKNEAGGVSRLPRGPKLVT